MSWKVRPLMDQRVEFIMKLLAENGSMSELCREYGISRKTGYKWRDRHRAEGMAGLADRSRVPHHCPHRIPESVVKSILACRDEYHWGPKKLRVLLQREHPDIHWPAISTMQEILKTYGRILPRKKRHRVPPHTQPFASCHGPNSVWCCDFKGQFHTGPGRACYPLTLTDAFSRYLLCCQGLYYPDGPSVRPFFDRAFREYGLPWAIRSDNGVPFASRAIAGLSRLSVWWIKLGIRPERIEPGKPQQNGRHERMHQTLKKETASPPADTPREQQERFDLFVTRYNQVRPHEALEMHTPSDVYQPSVRAYPDHEPVVAYPYRWTTRPVEQKGDVYLQGQRVFLSEVLSHELVGFEQVTDRYWRVYFRWVLLGVFDSATSQLLTPAQLRRHPELQPKTPVKGSSATLQSPSPET